MSQVGLFRVYTDTQNTALQLAHEAKAYAKAVKSMNWWRAQEYAQGRHVKQKMNAHYADALLLMPTTWVGSYVL